MLLYNWNELRRLKTFDLALSALMYLETRDIKFLKREQKFDSLRENFMKSVKPLYYSRATKQEKLVYMELISRRNYYEYKINAETRLHTDYAFGFSIEKLRRNSLITIADNYISFNLEQE